MNRGSNMWHGRAIVPGSFPKTFLDDIMGNKKPAACYTLAESTMPPQDDRNAMLSGRLTLPVNVWVGWRPGGCEEMTFAGEGAAPLPKEFGLARISSQIAHEFLRFGGFGARALQADTYGDGDCEAWDAKMWDEDAMQTIDGVMHGWHRFFRMWFPIEGIKNLARQNDPPPDFISLRDVEWDSVIVPFPQPVDEAAMAEEEVEVGSEIEIASDGSGSIELEGSPISIDSDGEEDADEPLHFPAVTPEPATKGPVRDPLEHFPLKRAVQKIRAGGKGPRWLEQQLQQGRDFGASFLKRTAKKTTKKGVASKKKKTAKKGAASKKKGVKAVKNSKSVGMKTPQKVRAR